MSIEMSVAFRILSFDEHPDSITKQLNRAPSQIWLKGQKRHPRATLIHQENGWELKSRLPKTVELQEHARAIIGELLPARLVLAKMPWPKVLSAAVSVHGDDRPALYIEAGVVQAIASLGASIDIDVIYYP
jgi:hypothetical protein